jgi:predicted metal-dependent phosphotriesterase family hydrolase
VSRVVSVLGPVDTSGDGWGPVDAHQHLFITGGVALERFPEIRLDDREACVRELKDVARAGGRVVIEATPIGLGRQPEWLAEASRRSGVTIVATTGFHRAAYYLHDHWVHQAGAERIAEAIVADLTEGIDAFDYAAPWIERTEVRAGLIKVGTEHHAITSTQERITEGVGIAHQRTGAPVTAHLEAGTFGVELLERLRVAGVPPDAISLAHVDQNPDPPYLRELAGAGAFLVFTTVGRPKYGPDSGVVALLADLAEAGYLDRLLVGGDMARRAMWRAYGGGPGLAWIFRSFHERLRKELGPEAVEAIRVTNPARAYGWREPA